MLKEDIELCVYKFSETSTLYYHEQILEFLLKNEDLKVYLEKLIETDKYGKSDFGMRNRIRDAIKDSSFEKVIEKAQEPAPASAGSAPDGASLCLRR